MFFPANVAAAVTCTILVLSITPYQLISMRYEQYHLISKLFCCLIPNMAVSFLAFLVGHFEGIGKLLASMCRF